MTTMPTAGQTVYIGPDCGAQYIACPMYARFIRVRSQGGWEGMAWIDVYQLDEYGVPFDQRELYVIAAGLRIVEGHLPADALPKPGTRHAEAHNTARIPRQRTGARTAGRTR